MLLVRSPRIIVSGFLGATLAVGVLTVLRLTLFAPARPGPVVVDAQAARETIAPTSPATQPAAIAVVPRKIVVIHPQSKPSSRPATPRPRARTQPAVASAPAPVPDTFEAQLAAGKQTLRDGRPLRALEYIQRAAAIRPDDTTGLQWLATALQANDRHAETIPLFQKLIRLRPDDTTARYNLAMALGREKKFQQAENVYWELLEIAPNHVEAHINLATLYQHECKLDSARRQWQKVIALRPNSFQAHEGLGEVLTDLGKADEAMDAFARAASLQPAVASAWLNYAASAVAAGGAGKALTALDRALKLAPYDPEAWSMRGDILLELYRTTKNEQHVRQAVVAWKKSLTLLPDQPRLQKNLKTYSRFDTKP